MQADHRQTKVDSFFLPFFFCFFCFWAVAVMSHEDSSLLCIVFWAIAYCWFLVIRCCLQPARVGYQLGRWDLEIQFHRPVSICNYRSRHESKYKSSYFGGFIFFSFIFKMLGLEFFLLRRQWIECLVLVFFLIKAPELSFYASWTTVAYYLSLCLTSNIFFIYYIDLSVWIGIIPIKWSISTGPVPKKHRTRLRWKSTSLRRHWRTCW